MGRVYEAGFSAASISAVQDIFSIQSTSGMAFCVREIVLTQITAVTIEAWRMTLKRFSGGYTIGAGGSALTPAKHNFNDAAATCTARSNDTTQTTGGTAVTIRPDGFNLINGYQYLAIPDKEIIISPSQAFVLSLDAAPAGTRVVNGAITFEELY
jgi:hypothetical protein